MKGEIFAITAVGLSGLIGGWLLRRYVNRRRLRLQVDRAQAAERRAARLVEAAGFRICAQQVTGGYTFVIDGQPRLARVRADLIARDSRRRYVVEVKTGSAAKPNLATTRRQLLEYHLAFAVQGVILADLERNRLHRVHFAFTRAGRPAWLAVVALLLGLTIGGLATLRLVARQPAAPPARCIEPRPAKAPRSGAG